MARSISLIQQQILDSIADDDTLSTLLTSTSKRAIYNLFAFIVAVAINVLEQLIDVFTFNIETIAASAAPASTAWLQNQVFLFQYSSDVPQIIQLINFAPSYPLVDPTLRIISRCSVTTSLSGKVIIKVATGNPPAPLSSPQISALTAFLNPPNGVGVAGINYSIVSLNPDQLFISANIFYQGQYSSVIKQNVIDAINNFLAAIPFNGQMRISDLEVAIKSVAGVNDVTLIDVSARPNSVSFGSGTPLVATEQTLSRLWNTVSGYMIGETTGGETFSDTLIFTPE